MLGVNRPLDQHAIKRSCLAMRPAQHYSPAKLSEAKKPDTENTLTY